MRNSEQSTPKSSRLKIVIIILAVLLVLSAGGLTARYVYLYFFVPTQSTITVPDNLIRGEDTKLQDIQAEDDSRSDDDTSLGDNDLLGEQTEKVIDNSNVHETGHSAGNTGETDDSVGNTDETGNAAENKPAAVKLELYEGKPGVNQRFEVENMLPGDTETTYFCIRTYHNADLELFFKTEVTEQTKKLGEILQIKVTHLETGKVLCDGAFSEVDGAEFSELLKKNAAGETTAYYQIDVSLDNSAGNAYQAADLTADFEWYVRDEGGLIPPKTGDTINLLLWITLAVSALLLIFFLLYVRHKKAAENSRRRPKIVNKLTASIIAVIALAACLSITTFALVYSMVSGEDNLFQTGQIKVNLNDGKPVIEEDEFLFEPGMTVEKKFFIENQGTWDVYYKLYLDNVEGGLADVMDVTIRDGDTVLYSGKADELQKEAVSAADDVLKLNERRELTIVFHYPETGGDSGQNQYLTFDLKVDVVQTKNNPGKQFS